MNFEGGRPFARDSESANLCGFPAPSRTPIVPALASDGEPDFPLPMPRAGQDRAVLKAHRAETCALSGRMRQQSVDPDGFCPLGQG